MFYWMLLCQLAILTLLAWLQATLYDTVKKWFSTDDTTLSAFMFLVATFAPNVMLTADYMLIYYQLLQ